MASPYDCRRQAPEDVLDVRAPWGVAADDMDVGGVGLVVLSGRFPPDEHSRTLAARNRDVLPIRAGDRVVLAPPQGATVLTSAGDR